MSAKGVFFLCGVEDHGRFNRILKDGGLLVVEAATMSTKATGFSSG
jgi:hypothetical protein